eukprot:SAG31_NODE_5644_length_2406_cov_30.208496_2_plen_78_part_00
MAVDTLPDVNRSIKSASALHQLLLKPFQLLDALEDFVAQNEDPASSPNLESEAGDDLQPLIRLLCEPSIEDNGITAS